MKQINLHKRNIIKQNLKKFLEGDLSFSGLKESLEGFLTLNFNEAPGLRKISDINIDDDIKLHVKPEHIKVILQKYIEGEISSLELSNWAAFIYMMPNYISEGKKGNERIHADESALMDVLQQLITPGIFGGLDIDKAREYLDQVSRPN
jgi:hypothetical protein